MPAISLPWIFGFTLNITDSYTPWNLQAQAMNSMCCILLGADKEQSSLTLEPAENGFRAEMPLIQQMVPRPLWLFQCYSQDNATSGADNHRSWVSLTFQSHLKQGRPAQWNAPAWPGLHCLRALIHSHKGKAVSVPHRDAEPSLIFGLRTWPIFKHEKIFQSNGEGVRKWRQDSSYHPANMSGLGVLPLTVTGPVFHPKS